MNYSTFSERLTASMREQNLKQVDFLREADRAGVKLGKSQMSQYVSGKAVPRKNIALFLAGVLNVDAQWLLHGRPAADSSAAETTADNNPVTTTTAPGSPPQPLSAASVPSDGCRPQKEKMKSPNFNVKGAITMNDIRKSSKLDYVLDDGRGPVVDEATKMEENGTSVLKLNIGNPAPFGFLTPDEVIYDMQRQLTECEGYSAAKGLFSARKAIMQYAQIKNIPNLSIEDIYTGNGVSELINLSMSALLNDSDEILVPAPDYPLWTACVTLAGGKAVHYLCDEEAEWYPDMDDIRKKITDRTKAIVIINPNNPTGAVYPREVLQEIVEIARQHQLIIFSDEIYDRLVMDDAVHIPIASLAPDLFCVTFSGLSKSHMIAGFRIGWMILSGNKKIARDYIEGLNMLSNMRLCSNVPAQSIVQTALGGYQSVNNYIVPGGRVYEQRDYIYKALNEIPGISAVKPKAAFYIFPKLDVKKFNIQDDEKFALDLLREKKLLIIHGGGFNWNQPDHFRIVYLPRIEVLKDAMGSLADFLQYYRQQVSI